MDFLGAVAAAPFNLRLGIPSDDGGKFRHSERGEIVQELINSFVRLSAAMSVYTLQQMQTAVDTLDTRDSVARLKKMIDSMTDALTAQIDDNKRRTVESISNLGADVVERTFDTLNVQGLKPHDIVETTNDMVRKTSDSLASIIRHDRHEDQASGTKHKGKAEETHHHATHKA